MSESPSSTPQRSSQLRLPKWAEQMRAVSWNVDTLKPDVDQWREHARRLVASGVNTVVAFWFGKDIHYRHILFDSAIYEVTHPGLGFQQVYDVLRLLCEICHEVGLKVIEHHGMAFVHYEKGSPIYCVPPGQLRYKGQAMQDWFCVDARSNGVSMGNYKSFMLCPNHEDFRAAVREVTMALMAAGIDGLMLDDISFAPSYTVCVCNSCREKFLQDGGIVLPSFDGRGFWGNFSNPDFRHWLRFRLQSTRDFHVDQARSIAEVQPEFAYLACNSTNLMVIAAQNQGWAYDQWIDAATVVHRENCNWQANFHCFPDTAIEDKVGKAIGRSKCAPTLNLMYPHSPEDYFFCWAQTKWLGSHFWGSYIHYVWQESAAHPLTLRTPPGDELAALGQCYLIERDFPQFFAGPNSRTLAEVAVVFSPSTRNLYGGNSDRHYSNELRGWGQALLRENILFDVLLESDITSRVLKRYRLLILPNHACMGTSQAEAILGYLRKGGKVIATHETALYDESGAARGNSSLTAAMGLKNPHPITGLDAEIALLPKGCLFANEAVPTPPGEVIAVEVDEASTIDAILSGPVAAHYTPMHRPVVAAHRAIGRGEAIWIGGRFGALVCTGVISSRVEGSRMPFHFKEKPDDAARRLMMRAIRHLLPELSIKVNAPEGVYVNALADDEGYQIHLINFSGAPWRGGEFLSEAEFCQPEVPPLRERLVISIPEGISFTRAEHLRLPKGDIRAMIFEDGRIEFPEGYPLAYSVVKLYF